MIKFLRELCKGKTAAHKIIYKYKHFNDALSESDRTCNDCVESYDGNHIAFYFKDKSELFFNLITKTIEASEGGF